jgi:6-phosphofructokinase 1
MEKKAFGILVGGGPAPGINGVISAVAIEAIKRGHPVYGILNGFKYLCQGDISKVRKLQLSDVTRIHGDGGTILGTSRANPRKSPESLANVAEALKRLDIGYLVTIGGDDTASSADAVSLATKGSVLVGHVPKTIDNDLPLPGKTATFGYQTAREVGTDITETLMEDAKATERWYLVIAMGRKAGHLALGIGISAGATLTLIPEEFRDEKLPLNAFVDIIVGSIIKRYLNGQPHGVVVLAEGLTEKLDVDSIPELSDAERDPHGHIRYAELDFGGILRRAIRTRLKELNIPDLLVVDKNVGYELRCHRPVPFDREYTRLLGYGIVDYLCGGGSRAMITRQGDDLVPLPFQEMIDPVTGRAKVRLVEVDSTVYRVAKQYMIRLQKEDLANDSFMSKFSELTKKSVSELRSEFSTTIEA